MRICLKSEDIFLKSCFSECLFCFESISCLGDMIQKFIQISTCGPRSRIFFYDL